MLGEFVEKGNPKVFPYFEGLINNNQEKKDKIDDWIKYGDYCVRLKHENSTENGFIKRSFDVAPRSAFKEDDHGKIKFETIQVKQQTRFVTHYQIASWPDKELPDEKIMKKMLDLLIVMIQDGTHKKMPLVHCSAGVGRTGTFIALLMILSALKECEFPEDFAVPKFFCFLRQHRKVTIQTPAQFALVWKISDLVLEQFAGYSKYLCTDVSERDSVEINELSLKLQNNAKEFKNLHKFIKVCLGIYAEKYNPMKSPDNAMDG